MNRSAILFVAVLMVLAGGMTLWTARRLAEARRAAGEPQARVVGQQAEYLKPPAGVSDWISDFTLTERSGETFSSKSLDGQVYVASFFFATCPASCRRQNEAMMRLHEEFGRRGVKFLSITCDPQTDSPTRLAEYARMFNAHPKEWLFLTGEMLYIRRIGAEKFRVTVNKQVHMDRLMVVDRWGKVRGHFNWTDEKQMEKMKTQLTELLAETEPPPEVKPAPRPAEEEDEEDANESARKKAAEPSDADRSDPSRASDGPSAKRDR